MASTSDLSVVVDLLAVVGLMQNFEVPEECSDLEEHLASKVEKMVSSAGQMTDVLVYLYDKHNLPLPKVLQQIIDNDEK